MINELIDSENSFVGGEGEGEEDAFTSMKWRLHNCVSNTLDTEETLCFCMEKELWGNYAKHFVLHS